MEYFNRFFCTLMVLTLSQVAMGKPVMISVTGTVSDFSGQPIEGAVVHFEDENFEPLFTAYTDAKGDFEIGVEERSYTIFAVKDYAEKYLEYWHWNFRPSANRRLDIRIDGIELYGIKAWKTTPAYNGIIVYTRPMSLKKWLDAGKPKGVAPIAPDLEAADVTATIEGKPAQIRGLNKVKEYITDKDVLDAYLIHIDPGDANLSRAEICLTMHDRTTKERGMGCIDLTE